MLDRRHFFHRRPREAPGPCNVLRMTRMDAKKSSETVSPGDWWLKIPSPDTSLSNNSFNVQLRVNSPSSNDDRYFFRCSV